MVERFGACQGQDVVVNTVRVQGCVRYGQQGRVHDVDGVGHRRGVRFAVVPVGGVWLGKCVDQVVALRRGVLGQFDSILFYAQRMVPVVPFEGVRAGSNVDRWLGFPYVISGVEQVLTLKSRKYQFVRSMDPFVGLSNNYRIKCCSKLNRLIKGYN